MKVGTFLSIRYNSVHKVAIIFLRRIFIILSHQKAWLNIPISVHELICGVEIEYLFGHLFFQIKNKNFVFYDNLQQIVVVWMCNMFFILALFDLDSFHR